MREIKFRAWDKEDKEMNHDVGVSKNGNFIIFAHDDDLDISEWYNHTAFQDWQGEKENPYVLMQYTGLKDSKSQDIYEGDILKSKFIERPLEVYWSERYLAFYVQFKKDVGTTALSLFKGEEYEVIGNIYENPSLVEG